MIRPRYITAMRSDSAMISSNSDETSSTASPRSRFSMMRVDVLDGADIQAARRLDGDQQLDRPRELARHDHLLLVAAREGEAWRSMLGVRMSNCWTRSSAARYDGLVLQHHPVGEGRW